MTTKVVSLFHVTLVFRETGMMGEPYQFEADIVVVPALQQPHIDRFDVFIRRYANRAHPNTRVVVGKAVDGRFAVGLYPKTVVTGVTAMVLDNLRERYREAVVWAIRRSLDNNCVFEDSVWQYLDDKRDPDKRN